jgi:hypothetical protein
MTQVLLCQFSLEARGYSLKLRVVSGVQYEDRDRERDQRDEET